MKLEKSNAKIYGELIDSKRYSNIVDKENTILKSRVKDFLNLLKAKNFICSNCGNDLAEDNGVEGFRLDFFDIPSRQKILSKIEQDE